MDLYFTGISDITMDSLKNYYLLLLKQIPEDKWDNIHLYITTTQKRKYKEKSNIKKSTSVDANKTASTTVLTRTLSTANE